MLVELNGKEVEMVFISNNFKWAASTVAELYLSWWGGTIASLGSSRWSEE